MEQNVSVVLHLVSKMKHFGYKMEHLEYKMPQTRSNIGMHKHKIYQTLPFIP
ncbi:hypothetical protein CLV25_10758 [Acetobacteroides hydrogenigenes]|uniref:Uncharacterized protein n=1 Tax=Acetobacteroides hydrogenigenes TaxID=979970 RepID=A0A4R2ESV7_9BACT|nr:hypothetical protein CLV25_10758 [Acetobacteroides hydrogenigenes]